MTVPQTGTLQETPLPALFETLHAQQFSGTLTVSAGSFEKSVVMKDGQIVFATSTENHHRLGEILIKEGKLSRDQLETALQDVKRSAGFKKLGAVLVENGFVAPKDLFVGLKTQVKEIIYSLFLLADGQYRIEQKLPQDVIHLQIGIEELISEIIQRLKKSA